MLVPSKKLFYAVEAVFYIAYNAKDAPISGRDVAAAQGLPTRYLEPMMQKLVRAGILRGVRGPAGGYVLGRERRRILITDIADALGKESWPESLTVLGTKILSRAADEWRSAWRTQLATISIASLCERAQAANISAIPVSNHDFII